MSDNWKQINDPELEEYQMNEDGNIKDKWGTILEPGSMCVGYKVFTIKGKTKWCFRYQHRLLAQTFLENPDNKPICDHIDRNKSNNSLSNLRWVSRGENAVNSKVRSDNTSGLKGVIKQGKRWKAVCQNKYLGVFETKELAYEAYKNKAQETFGIYANV